MRDRLTATVFDGLLDDNHPAAPAGDPTHNQSIYMQIREARREDDPDLPQGAWHHQLKRADWDRVITLSRHVLRHTSKDLQAAVWLIEAATRKHGVVAVGPGLEFLTRFVDRWWPHLNSPEDDANDERCWNLIDWLDHRLERLLRVSPLFDMETPQGRVSVSWSDYADAIPDESRHSSTEEDGPVLEALRNPASHVASERLAALASDLDAIFRALGNFNTQLDVETSDGALRLVRIGDALDDIYAATWSRIQDYSTLGHTGHGRDETQTELSDAGERAGAQRDILYGTLEDIARQLRQLEPESITPNLIESAARWRGVTFEAAKEQVGETEDLGEVLSRLVVQTLNDP